jgi:hypothetical protein
VSNDAAGEYLKDRVRLVGDYDGYDLSPQAFEQEFLPIARENPDVMQALADHTPARHPSQLYEGILEGLLIFALLYIIRISFPRLWHGVISGGFFILYAIFRIGVENVREPDSENYWPYQGAILLLFYDRDWIGFCGLGMEEQEVVERRYSFRVITAIETTIRQHKGPCFI